MLCVVISKVKGIEGKTYLEFWANLIPISIPIKEAMSSISKR